MPRAASAVAAATGQRPGHIEMWPRRRIPLLAAAGLGPPDGHSGARCGVAVRRVHGRCLCRVDVVDSALCSGEDHRPLRVDFATRGVADCDARGRRWPRPMRQYCAFGPMFGGRRCPVLTCMSEHARTRRQWIGASWAGAILYRRNGDVAADRRGGSMLLWDTQVEGRRPTAELEGARCGLPRPGGVTCGDLVAARRCADETPRRLGGRLASALTTPCVAIAKIGTDRTRGPRRARCRPQGRVNEASLESVITARRKGQSVRPMGWRSPLAWPCRSGVDRRPARHDNEVPLRRTPIRPAPVVSVGAVIRWLIRRGASRRNRRRLVTMRVGSRRRPVL